MWFLKSQLDENLIVILRVTSIWKDKKIVSSIILDFLSAKKKNETRKFKVFIYWLVSSFKPFDI